MSAEPIPAVGDMSSRPFVLRNHVWALVYCGFFAIGAFLFGYDQAYFGGVVAMNPFIDKFGDQTDAEGVKSFGATLLAVLVSIIQVGDLLGALISGVVGFYFGRKGGLATASILCCVAIILQAAAQNIATFIAGRVVLGLAVGVLSGAVPLYLSDVAPKQIRGMVVGSWQLILAVAGVVGAGICQGTENYSGQASYQIPICFQLICPLAMMTFIWFVPESPRFLISKDRVEDARASLYKINRGVRDYDPAQEIAEYMVQQDAENATKTGSWLQLITDPIERRKLYCCAGIFVAQQFTGMTFLATYCTVFTEDLHVANAFAINEIMNALAVVGVMSSWTFIERVNRRTVLICSTSFMICVMFTIGGLASGPEQEPLVPIASYGKTIIGLILIYALTFNMTWGPLAWTVATEMCVGRNRPRIMAVSVGAFWVVSWLVTFTLPYLYTTAGLGAKIGFVYGSTACLSLIFVLFVLPESRGRLLEEIEELYNNKVPARKWAGYQTLVVQEAMVGVMDELEGSKLAPVVAGTEEGDGNELGSKC